MFLRNEVNDRLVMTMPDWRLGNIYTVTIDEIIDSGLFPIKERSYAVKEVAQRIHEATVRKIENEGKPLPRCRCGQIARQFSRIVNDWICAECWDLDVGERS